MQVTVTKGAFKKSGKLKSKSVIATILIFVFAFVSTVILIQMKKKTLVFEEHYFYFVCADSSKKVGILDNEKEYLKNIGGASVTHFYKENFYLVANVYLNLSDAEEINAGLINNFPRSEVVTIKTEKVPKQAKNSIKNDVWLLNFVKFLYEYNKQFYLNSMDFYTGKQTESDFISSLVSKSLEFDEFKKNMDKDSAAYSDGITDSIKEAAKDNKALEGIAKVADSKAGKAATSIIGKFTAFCTNLAGAATSVAR